MQGKKGLNSEIGKAVTKFNVFVYDKKGKLHRKRIPFSRIVAFGTHVETLLNDKGEFRAFNKTGFILTSYRKYITSVGYVAELRQYYKGEYEIFHTKRHSAIKKGDEVYTYERWYRHVKLSQPT
jgi:hypothetical protein